MYPCDGYFWSHQLSEILPEACRWFFLRPGFHSGVASRTIYPTFDVTRTPSVRRCPSMLGSNLASFFSLASFSSLDSPQSPLCGPLGPSNSIWDALNSTVGGRLYIGRPWAKACFSMYENDKIQPNDKECEYVKQNYFNNHCKLPHLLLLSFQLKVFSESFKCIWRVRFGAFVLNSFKSYILILEQTQYEMCMSTGDSCLLDWLNPSNPAAHAPTQQCKQGGISPFYVCLWPKTRRYFD